MIFLTHAAANQHTHTHTHAHTHSTRTTSFAGRKIDLDPKERAVNTEDQCVNTACPSFAYQMEPSRSLKTDNQ